MSDEPSPPPLREGGGARTGLSFGRLRGGYSASSLQRYYSGQLANLISNSTVSTETQDREEQGIDADEGGAGAGAGTESQRGCGVGARGGASLKPTISTADAATLSTVAELITESGADDDDEHDPNLPSTYMRLCVASLELVDYVAEALLEAVREYPYYVLCAHATLAARAAALIPLGTWPAYPGTIGLPLSLGLEGLSAGFSYYALLKVIDAVHEYDLFPHAYYVFTGDVVPESMATHADLALLGTAALTIVPEIALHTVLVRTMLHRTGIDPPPPTVMALLLSEHGAVVDGHGILGVPWWKICLMMLVGAGDGQVGTPTLECLPAAHPLAERRSLFEQVWATPTFPGLLLAIYYKEPLPNMGFGDHLNLSWRALKALPVGYGIGFLSAMPLQVPYHYLHRALKRSAKGEDGEKHLARRLQHAAENALRVRGSVEAPSLFDAGAAAAAMLLPTRQGTEELKSEAIEGLDAKREVLEGKLEHYRERMALANPFMEEQSKITVDRSLGVAAALPAVALLSSAALSGGGVMVEYEHELGQDLGGVFRGFMDSIAGYIATETTHFAPAPDGGLLPIRQQKSGIGKHVASGGHCGGDESEVQQLPPLGMGREVMITGLESRPDLNGMRGTVQGEDKATLAEAALDTARPGWAMKKRRWHVLLDGGDGARKIISLKSDSLTVIVPPCGWQEELFAIGRLLALAVTESTPLDVCMSRCLYKVLLGEKITASDVARIDPSFAQHRISALLEPGGVAAMENLGIGELTFVGVPVGGTEEEEEELIPNGRNVVVTEDNKLAYATLLVEHYLVGRCRDELAVLVEGFHDVIPKKVLRSCGLRAVDLELLVTGLPGIDIEDWKQHCRAADFKKPGNSELGDWFWRILREMDVEERAKVLAFACGSGRLAAGGFGSLEPRFKVEVNQHEDPSHLPSAHTCFNTLCIPRYTSRAQFKTKLKIAIHADSGFGVV